jgi:hypothetical protein
MAERGRRRRAGYGNGNDAFPDPADSSHVLALATVLRPGNVGLSSLFASKDGGLTFGDPVYSASSGDLLSGVEIARSDAQTVYLTMVSYSNP